MAKKLVRRLTKTKSAGLDVWLAENVVPFDDFARLIDSALLEEACEFRQALEARAKPKLESLGVGVGGAGHIELLYFVVKRMKRKSILETGVSVGYSSSTILSALGKEPQSVLYSSDLPYFRLPNPERLVGCLVEEPRPANWHLFVEGDEVNVPNILKQSSEPFDLVHYDSDKTYQGKDWFYRTLQSEVSKDAIWIFDDIQDDDFFYNLVTLHKLDFQVFLYGGKYVGLVGQIS